MSDFIEGESRGGHSNFKGSFYHLIYTLCRLVRFPNQRVGFYRGNDLVASLISPPHPDELTESAPVLSSIESDDCDIWCQLKNTQDAWTVSSVLKENLLFNFIGNSFISDSRGRSWEVELVTTAEIRGRKLRDFAAEFERTDDRMNGDKVVGSIRRLNEIIEDCVTKIADADLGITPSRNDVARRAVEIVKRLADTKPFAAWVMLPI